MIRQLVMPSPRSARESTETASLLALLRAEFPTVELREASHGTALDVLPLDVERWSAEPFDAFAFDEQVFAAAGDAPFALQLVGAPAGPLPPLALEVLTRYQCLVHRRNAHSATPRFDGVLAEHLRLHDLSRPLVRADHSHALDTWQWVLRLAPDAGLALQAAALFHDVERLVSESGRRIEQHAADYQAFKDAHARAGADLAIEALRRAGVDAASCEQVHGLVSRHERPGDDEELARLNDADALSFFSLNAPGFERYYGPTHTAKKVAYTLGRLRPQQRWRLGHLRVPASIRHAIATSDIATGGRGPG